MQVSNCVLPLQIKPQLISKACWGPVVGFSHFRGFVLLRWSNFDSLLAEVKVAARSKEDVWPLAAPVLKWGNIK